MREDKKSENMIETLLVKFLEGVIVNPAVKAFNTVFKRKTKDILPDPKTKVTELKLNSFQYDVFLAAPMESHSSSTKYKATRRNVLDLKACLITDCSVNSVYFAGENIKSNSGFDDESLSLEMNLREIKNSKCFMLIFPEYKPSSTLVEVGMALALGMESIWFFKRGITRPFVLRDGADASNRGDLPRITVYEFDDYNEIETILKRKKGNLYEALDDC